MDTTAATPDPTADKPPRTRWWIPLSLRISVVMLGFLGAVSSWKGICAYRQHLALEKILEMNGNVGTDYDPLDPPWIEKWLGYDVAEAFGTVHAVDARRFSRLQLNDIDFGALPDLKWLWLEDTAFSDEDLVDLRQMSNLEDLHLHGTKVTGPGFASLAKLKRLERLDLSDTPFTDAGMPHLAGFKNLKFLDLSHTCVSDAGIAHLKTLTSLEELSINATRLTDAGLTRLEGLARLRSLSVDDTDVTSRGATMLNWACPHHPIRNYMPRSMKEPGDPFGVIPLSKSRLVE